MYWAQNHIRPVLRWWEEYFFRFPGKNLHSRPLLGTYVFLCFFLASRTCWKIWQNDWLFLGRPWKINEELIFMNISLGASQKKVIDGSASKLSAVNVILIPNSYRYSTCTKTCISTPAMHLKSGKYVELAPVFSQNAFLNFWNILSQKQTLLKSLLALARFLAIGSFALIGYLTAFLEHFPIWNTWNRYASRTCPIKDFNKLLKTKLMGLAKPFFIFQSWKNVLAFYHYYFYYEPYNKGTKATFTVRLVSRHVQYKFSFQRHDSMV